LGGGGGVSHGLITGPAQSLSLSLYLTAMGNCFSGEGERNEKASYSSVIIFLLCLSIFNFCSIRFPS
jgi:hypothetical protein